RLGGEADRRRQPAGEGVPAQRDHLHLHRGHAQGQRRRQGAVREEARAGRGARPAGPRSAGGKGDHQEARDRAVKRLLSHLIWLGVAVAGAGALGMVALHRGEALSSTWFLTAAICVYAVGYRFYSAFLAAKALSLDDSRVTAAHRLRDGKDFLP